MLRKHFALTPEYLWSAFLVIVLPLDSFSHICCCTGQKYPTVVNHALYYNYSMNYKSSCITKSSRHPREQIFVSWTKRLRTVIWSLWSILDMTTNIFKWSYLNIQTIKGTFRGPRLVHQGMLRLRFHFHQCDHQKSHCH